MRSSQYIYVTQWLCRITLCVNHFEGRKLRHCDLFKFLCTGVFLYAPYSLLLISNKLWMGEVGVGGWGVSGGEARGPSWRGRIRGVEQGG
jgi:hypothetical protein